jgi:hypothetical protein
MSRHDSNPPYYDEMPYSDAPLSRGSGSGYQSGAGRYSERSSEFSSQIGESTHDMVDRGREKATAQLDSQRMRIAEGLDGLAQAIRATSRELQGEQATLASYANQGAARVDHFAHYLQDHDVDELVHDVERYARQRPALFIGGAFALGLIAARFLKSSNR